MTITYPLLLLEKAVRVSTAEVAWSAESAHEVIDWCRDQRLVILGGDVLEQVAPDTFMPTYDTWFLPSVVDRPIDSGWQLAHDKVAFYTTVHRDRVIVFVLVITPAEVADG